MSGIDAAIKILLVVVVAAAVQLVVRESITNLVRRVVRGQKYASKTEEKKREDTLLHVFRPLNRAIIWFIALVVILSILGVNFAVLLTGAGTVGLVVGIIAQSAFKDYIAGVYIIVENQFRVGDVVLLAGTTSGTVEDISIRVTKLRDLDGNLHFVRNGDAGVITNMTAEWARANVDLQVGWSADIDKIEKIINEVGAKMAAEEQWRELIVEPIKFYRVDSFSDSAITVKALGTTTPINQWTVAGEFRRRIKKAFEEHGIEPPYPQRVVHEGRKLNEGGKK